MELEEIKSAAENATKKFETAMNAWETVKTEVLPLGKKFEDLDADTKAKLAKTEKAIADAVDLGQKAQAKALALEEQQKEREKAVEAELSALKTAMNRAPSGSDNPETKAKELAAKRNKLFNEFVRTKGKEDYEDFVARRVAEDPEMKALSVGTDSAGGYLVMPEFGGVIQTKVFESSPIRMLASVTSTNSDSIEFVLDNDEAACGWTHETGTRSETNTPTLGKLAIVAEEVYAKPKATQKMLDDASIDMEAWLAGKVAEAFARKEATAFVAGSGVGQPRGLLSYTAGTAIASSEIEQVVTGSASTFTYAGCVNLTSALKEAYQSNASFLVRRASLSNLLLILDGNGTPIFNLDYKANAGTPPASLMGRPLYFAADVPAVATSALAMIYGDIRQAYQIVDRRGITMLRDPYSSKPYVEFYTTKRVGGGVINFEAVKIGKIST